MMTKKDKQQYLASEISKFLPLFQKLPTNFKKEIISHHNLSTKIKTILNTTPVLSAGPLTMKPKKGKSKPKKKRGGSRPLPAERPKRPNLDLPIAVQPTSDIPTGTSDVNQSFQQLGHVHLAHNALLNQRTLVVQEQRRQQTDIDSMNAVVLLQTGASNSLSQIFAENIKIIQYELNEIKTDLKEIDTKREEFIQITLQSLNEEWDTEIKSAKTQWQKYGEAVTSGVKEYESKDRKAKLCGATCGATSGYLVRDMIITGGNAVKDFLDIPTALADGTISLGSKISDIFEFRGWHPGKLLGVPISSVGSMFSGTASTFTEPITNMINHCGPQCGALIGLSCCICTSAICITLLQEQAGVSDRLISNDRQQQNWLMRQLSDGTQIASWALVVPLIRDTLGHSKSTGYKEAIQKQKAYETNQQQYVSYIKKQDMLKGNNPTSLVNKNEWLNQALKINQSLIDIKTKTDLLTQNIKIKNEELQNEMRARSNASMRHVESVWGVTAPDALAVEHKQVTSPHPSQSSLRRRRSRTVRRSGSDEGSYPELPPAPQGGGYLKRPVKSKRLRRNRKSVKIRNKKRSRRN